MDKILICYITCKDGNTHKNYVQRNLHFPIIKQKFWISHKVIFFGHAFLFVILGMLYATGLMNRSYALISACS